MFLELEDALFPGGGGDDVEGLVELGGRVCSLVTMQRMRALPSGTVGKAMPVAMTPRSKRARERSHGFAAVAEEDRGDGGFACGGGVARRCRSRPVFSCAWK